NLGRVGVWMGALTAACGVVFLLIGLRRRDRVLLRQARVYAVLTLVSAIIAFIAMERALITRDFELVYVARNGSHATPALYNFASLWGALEGAILLWALVLCGFSVAVVAKFRRRLEDPLVGWAMVVIFAVTLFFFALMLGPANPFHTALPAPLDGPGPN